MFSALFLHETIKYRGRFFCFVILFYCLLLAFLRGDVGTDTHTYELILARIEAKDVAAVGEIGFIFISHLLLDIFPSVEVSVRAISLVFFGIMFLYIYRSNNDERFLMLSFFLPSFAYLYSMNVLRVGLASVLLLIVSQSIRKSGSLGKIKYGALSFSFHYSILFSFFFLYISRKEWMRLSFFLSAVFFLMLSMVILYYADYYFFGKLVLYQGMASPTNLSGLGKIIPIIIILLALFFGNLPLKERAKLAALSLFFLFFAWAVAKKSYAGLRLLDLLSFVIPITILLSYSRYSASFDWKIKSGFVVAGLLSTIAVYRGFLDGYGDGPSPFLPYEFYFN